MASTDTGHEIEEGSAFLTQPEARLDNAYRGVHLATLASKRIIAHYYGREIDRAYLQGCSNGGRPALLEAERFPDDYAGIIAGAPLFRLQEFLAWMVAVHDLQDAHPLTKEAFTVLGDASRATCDVLDGVADGVINDPRICQVDVEALQVMPLDQPQSVLLWPATNPRLVTSASPSWVQPFSAPPSRPMIVACIRPGSCHPNAVGPPGFLS